MFSLESFFKKAKAKQDWALTLSFQITLKCSKILNWDSLLFSQVLRKQTIKIELKLSANVYLKSNKRTTQLGLYLNQKQCLRFLKVNIDKKKTVELTAKLIIVVDWNESNSRAVNLIMQWIISINKTNVPFYSIDIVKIMLEN